MALQFCSLVCPLQHAHKKGPSLFCAEREPKCVESCQKRAVPAGWRDGWQSSAESCLIWVKDTAWEAALPELPRCVGAAPFHLGRFQSIALEKAKCQELWRGQRSGESHSPFTSVGMRAAVRLSMVALEFLW